MAHLAVNLRTMSIPLLAYSRAYFLLRAMCYIPAPLIHRQLTASLRQFPVKYRVSAPKSLHKQHINRLGKRETNKYMLQGTEVLIYALHLLFC